MKLNKSVILGFLILIGIFYLLKTLFHRKRKKFDYSLIEGAVTRREIQKSYNDGSNINADYKAQQQARSNKENIKNNKNI